MTVRDEIRAAVKRLRTGVLVAGLEDPHPCIVVRRADVELLLSVVAHAASHPCTERSS